MPIKAIQKLLRRTFILCAALSFSSVAFAADTPDFHRWNQLVNSNSTILFYKTEAQLKNITTNNTSGSTLLHGKSELKREPAASPLTYTYVATPDLGYHFAHWSCTPIQITEVESSIYPFCYGENPELVFYVNKGSDSRTFKINLCPLFEPNAYTIKFAANGASGSMANLAMTYDTAKNLTANGFTKTGYSFKSWLDKSTNKSYANKASVKNLTSVNGATVTLTAQWTNNVYTVSFDTQGGSPTTVASRSVSYNTAYNSSSSFPSDPTRAGYDFLGWALTSTATTGSITGDSLVQTAKNHTLYAIWEAKSYTVTYNANGGTVSPTSSNVVFGQKYQSLPSAANCTWTGYTFAGWYTAASGGTQVTADTVVSSAQNHTLYAHWTAKTYTVTFNKNGGNAPSKTSITVTYDSTYGTLPTCTRTGYTFAGWYTAATGGTKIETNTKVSITAAQTLYAHWNADPYTVKFEGNGATRGTMYDQTVEIAKVANLKSCSYSRTGYTFDGWAKSSTGQVVYENNAEIKDIASPGGTITLYAVWSPIKYMIAFYAGGGEGEMASVEATYDEEVALPVNGFKREHYDFSGWKFGSDIFEGGANVRNLATTATTVTLSAQWTAKCCTVTFDPGAGTIADGKATKEVQYNTQYGVLPTPDDLHGYDFKGWNLETSGYHGQIYDTSYVPISTNHTVTAIWTAKAEYTVKFDTNGGEKLDEKKYIGDYTYGDRGLPTPVKTGYTFVKWHYADSDEAVTNDSPMLKNNHTLYATWQANQYEVTFVVEGVTYETIAETYDSTYNLPATNPEKTGYAFYGWYTAETEGTKIEATTAVKITAAQTLYARFGANEYTIVFDKNHPNAVAAPTSKTLKYDDVYELPDFAEGETNPNPSYRFVGWKHNPEDSSDPLPAGTEVSKLSTGDDYIFYAIWELALNDLSAAAHCKNAEVDSEDWEIVEGAPTSIRSKISAIGGNHNSKELSLAIRGSGTLYFLAKRSSTMSDKLSLHLRGEDNGVKIDKTIATTANWQLFSFPLTNVTKDFRLVIDYPEATIPFSPTTEDHRYYLDEIVWLPEGESYEESREKFEVTVTATNFESWTSVPAADADGVIHVYEGDPVKVWGTPLDGYTTSHKSEASAYSISSVKKNETIVLTATQDIQLSDLAKAANCKNIDIVCSNGVSSDLGWEKVGVENDVGIWSLSPYTYNGITLTASTKGKGILSFDYKTSSDTMNSGLEFAYRVITAGVPPASVAWITLLDGGTKITTYTTKELSLDGDAKIEWRVTTSRGITPSATKNRYYLNNIKWLAEGEEDTPDDPPAKTELEQWAELLGCAATEEAVAAAKSAVASELTLSISIDSNGKPVVSFPKLDTTKPYAAKVKIEGSNDITDPNSWIDCTTDPSPYHFFRGVLAL